MRPVKPGAAPKPQPLVPWRERSFQLAFGAAALLHMGLVAWSIADPSRLLLGDRAITRLKAMQALLESSARLPVMLQLGAPGDYGVQAFLWSVGGPGLLLAVQLAAFLGSLVLLYWMMRQLDIPARASGVAIVAYAVLPSNLHQPHTLMSEALFNPLVIVVGLGAVRIFGERSLGLGRATWWGAAAGCAVLIRAVFLPVLPALSAVLIAIRGARWRALALANVLAIFPLGIWAGIAHLHGQPFELGGQNFGFRWNLEKRMQRMGSLGGSPIPASLEHSAGLADYLAYAFANPVPFARIHATDVANLVVNPGVNHTFGRFLHLFPMDESTSYWPHLVETQGFLAAARELARRQPARIACNAVVTLAWLAFLAVALWGANDLGRGPHRPVACALGLILALVCAGSFAADAVRWGHRSPGEFALAVFFAAGLARLAPHSLGAVAGEQPA